MCCYCAYLWIHFYHYCSTFLPRWAYEVRLYHLVLIDDGVPFNSVFTIMCDFLTNNYEVVAKRNHKSISVKHSTVSSIKLWLLRSTIDILSVFLPKPGLLLRMYGRALHLAVLTSYVAFQKLDGNSVSIWTLTSLLYRFCLKIKKIQQ